MSDSTDTARPGIGPVSWVVAALGFLYYCQLLALPLINPSRHLDPGLVAMLLGPGLVAMLLLVWLRRAPIPVAVSLAGLWLLSPAVFGPAMAAQAHIARHRRGIDAIAVACTLIAAKSVIMLRDPSGNSATRIEVFISATGVIIALLVGLLDRSTTDAKQQRAAAQAARQDAWEAQLNETRLVERERIAREMHDVVAHRISLIALHAGALAHHMRSDEGEAGDLARAIQTNAQSSLDELRTMLARLRGNAAPPEPPQPTLSGLDALLADARSAGQQVAAELDGDPAEVPDRVSRHAYRIVQEGLTNARKHAPGSPVALSLETTSDRLRVVVRNRLADLAQPDRSGSGLGLVGIAERIDLVGGDLSHGIEGEEFILKATLPYTPEGTA
ncbi:histidine kinase [Arachnia propionica]|uniref:sensor histidine kinase n=1 Tax=Arachnia propionica TaxID=1750 RepID=UPI0030D47067